MYTIPLHVWTISEMNRVATLLLLVTNNSIRSCADYFITHHTHNRKKGLRTEWWNCLCGLNWLINIYILFRYTYNDQDSNDPFLCTDNYKHLFAHTIKSYRSSCSFAHDNQQCPPYNRYQSMCPMISALLAWVSARQLYIRWYLCYYC